MIAVHRDKTNARQAVVLGDRMRNFNPSESARNHIRDIAIRPFLQFIAQRIGLLLLPMNSLYLIVAM
jgi:hypothetical protein